MNKIRGAFFILFFAPVSAAAFFSGYPAVGMAFAVMALVGLFVAAHPED